MARAGCAWCRWKGAASWALAPRRPKPGLKVQTTTPEIREIRRIAVELLLANHDQSCPTCSRSANCQLQSLAQRLGVKKVRFKSVHKPAAARRFVPVAGARSEQVRALRRLRAHVLGDPGHRRHRLRAPRARGLRAAGLRQAAWRRGVRQLRAMRQRLPHRRADAEVGGG